MPFDKKQLPLIFLHVPRTGGLAMSKIFFKLFKDKEMFLMYVDNPEGVSKDSVEKFISLPQLEKEKILYLGGHASFGLHRYYDQFTYFTMIRNPVKRIISVYGLALGEPEHYLHKMTISNQWSLTDFVESKISTEFDNGMVRMLSGIENVPFGKCTNEMYDRAIYNFDKYFPTFGITEKFYESVCLLNLTYGLKIDKFKEKVNTSKVNLSEAQKTDEVIELITKYNEFDLKLYQYANEKFEKIKAKHTNFNQQLEELYLSNANYNEELKPTPLKASLSKINKLVNGFFK
ncbi:hypothetical protein ASF10_22415 [Flavobacterium sp. Leaf82]|jgi:hypothetical protein|uniref:sulfotransferase family 2 domain-containing protein n=1 Tax=unclassified Flavobacterium TaxID=196869 RepID=UPI0006FF0AD3|nr:sulfotransferase family 2 domain-containing protein [Flavobacterium sp. Leaf82]KQO30758.1 hypothetical protein ASF10_22415 [Flavobacterium sp. Leaf82]